MHVPASWAVRGYGVPDVCVRHGLAAAPRRVGVTVYPAWTWIFLAVGVVPFVLVRYLAGKTIVLPAWPVCDRCRRRRLTALAVSGVLVVLGLVAMVAPFLADGLGPVVIMLGLFSFSAGLIAVAWTPWSRALGVRVDEQLVWLTIAHVHPEFQARFAPFEAKLQAQLQAQSQG
jgi:hypothetical protein